MAASRATRPVPPDRTAAALLASPDVTSPDPRLVAVLAPLRDHPRESAVLCDVDGTLAPIAPRPEDAMVPEASMPVLRALRDRMRLLGFVSGRSLRDVERMVGLGGCAYAGNHGMEIHLPGRPPRLADGVEAHLPAIAAFAASWPAARREAADVRLEEKGATLSFHTRGARDPEAAARLLESIAEDARARGLVPTLGREVLEVRPPVPIDKGTAVRALLEGAGVRRALYAGDDRTDADAWRALRAMRDEGALDAAVGLAVVSGEVPPAVHASADIEVPGIAGALAALAHLAQ
jgi:trehalose-phosphatase